MLLCVDKRAVEDARPYKVAERFAVAVESGRCGHRPLRCCLWLRGNQERAGTDARPYELPPSFSVVVTTEKSTSLGEGG